MEKDIEEIYCNKEVGQCLYQDNLLCIERVELIGDIFRLFSKNEKTDEIFIKKLDEYKKKGAFYSLKKITSLGYDNEFIDFLYKCLGEQNITNDYSLRKGIFTKGYLEKTSNIIYSKDLRPSIEMTLIMNDILVPVICYKNKIYRNLTFNSAKFINSLSLKNNNLIIGLDSGYLLYLNKEKNYNIYIYEENIEYVEFFKTNILNKMKTNLNITFLNELDYKFIKDNNIDNIIVDNSEDIDINLKKFIEFRLIEFKNILNIDNLEIYLNKLKVDLRDIIMSGHEKFEEVLLENFKDFKGIDSSLLSAELDFCYKTKSYFEKNPVFYTNYKKVQKDLNKEDLIFKILLEE